MSPARNLPVSSGSISLPSTRASAAATLEHGGAPAAADVDRLAVGAVALQREPARARDVADVDEVAPLGAVLVDSGARPFSRREAKIASTPVYGFESAWRGP